MSPLDLLLQQTFAGCDMLKLSFVAFDEAIVAGKKAQRQKPSYAAAYCILASAFRFSTVS